MKFLQLIACLLLSFTLSAQDSTKVDALLSRLEHAQEAVSKCEILCKLSQEYRDFKPKLAITYGKKAIILAQKLNNKSLIAKAYNNTGAGYFLLGDYETATTYYYGALKIREELGDSAGLRASYINIANIYASQGQYKDALKHYKKVLQLAEQNKDHIAASRALNNIGKVYQILKDYDRSISYYKRAIPLKEHINDTKGLIMSLNNIGNILNLKGYHVSALASFDKALPLADKIGSLHDKIYIFRGKAISYKLDQDYEQAIVLGNQSLELAKRLNEKEEIKLSADVLNKIYTAMGDFKKAHSYLNLYTVYNDSISNERIKNQIALVQVKYETEKKARENLKLIAEQKLHLNELEQKEIIQYFFIAILMLACIVAIVLYIGSRRLKRFNAILIEKNKHISRSSAILNSQKEALTEQAKQLQEQKQELERLNAIKDRLFSVIAHDLRGPLVSLKGLLQVMAIGKIPAETQEQLFKSLVKGQQNVLWMLDNLFDWARAQMKGFEVEKQDLDLYTLTDENIRLLLPIAISKGIILKNKIPPGELVSADKEMMKLVLRNLISNAIKFCKEGDHIAIFASRSMDLYTITIKDTGVGIAPEIMPRLFGQGSYSSRGTAEEKGSGLGLALCKDFIEQNGGTIWIESTPGIGSAFSFTLPVSKSANKFVFTYHAELLQAKL